MGAYEVPDRYAMTDGPTRLATAKPVTTDDGQRVSRVGVWAGNGVPIVLTEDEVAVALAWSRRRPRQYGISREDLAGRVVLGVARLGRPRLRVLADRHRRGVDHEVWPGVSGPGLCLAAARMLCTAGRST